MTRRKRTRGPRGGALHFQAREADVSSRHEQRSMRGQAISWFNLRTLDGGSWHPPGGVPGDYAVCRAVLPPLRVARTLAQITCAGCRQYYMKYVGSK